MADVTGLLAAGAVAALGLYVIPARRRRAQKELQAKITNLRDQLSWALSEQFERELARSVRRLREALQPYTQFVEAQEIAVTTAEKDLNETVRALDDLAEQIAQL